MNRSSIRRRLLAVALPLLAAGCATTPTGGMQPGMWEMTLATNVAGLPVTMPLLRECVTQKDIDDPIRTLPRPDGNCTLSNIVRQRDRATYDIACVRDTQSMQGRAQIAYAGDHYNGNVTMTVTEKGVQGAPLSFTISAQRVGECGK